MKASCFNIFEPWQGRWIVFNSLTGKAVPVSTTVMAALKRGKIERLPAATLARLAELALVVEDQVDEPSLLLNTSWPVRTADVTALSAKSTGAGEKSIEAALQFMLRCQQRGQIELAKFRICGWSERPLAERRAELDEVRATCQQQGVNLITVWTIDQLEEALSVAELPAEAFFFRWNLSRAPAEPGGDAWDAVLDLLRQGKSLIIQLAISEISDIDQWTETLQWVGSQAELVKSSSCLWDLTIASDRHPVYFLPSLCLEDSDPAYGLLPVGRELLARLGIPVRPAIAPYQMHPGCPFRFSLAYAYDRQGNRHQCLLELGDLGHSDSGESEVFAQATDTSQLEDQIRRCGTRCAYLPFCLARCPRMQPLEPESSACARRKRVLEQELSRMLTTGQMQISSL